MKCPRISCAFNDISGNLPPLYFSRKELLVNRFWNGKRHSDVFHKPTWPPPPPPNKTSNLIFDVTLYIKINPPTYWRIPPKPAAILISSTNDGSTLELNIYEGEYEIGRNRSSRPGVFCGKGVLRNFTKVTGKHLCQSLFFNKVASLFFNRTPPVAASEEMNKSTPHNSNRTRGM